MKLSSAIFILSSLGLGASATTTKTRRLRSQNAYKSATIATRTLQGNPFDTKNTTNSDSTPDTITEEDVANLPDVIVIDGGEGMLGPVDGTPTPKPMPSEICCPKDMTDCPPDTPPCEIMQTGIVPNEPEPETDVMPTPDETNMPNELCCPPLAIYCPPNTPPCMYGTNYCTYAPDKSCFESGWPKCCGDDSMECPDKQPPCEEGDPYIGLVAEESSMSMSIPATVVVDPTESIYEIASGNENFSTLISAIDAAGLVDALNGEDGTLTVFAPRNSAFNKLLLSKLLEPTWQPQLKDLLLYHVLGNEVRSSDLIYDTMGTTTLNGEDITITLEPIRVNDANILVDEGLVDIEATNGVIHAIDSVLTPRSVTLNIEDIVCGADNLSTLCDVIGKGDLNDSLASFGPFTLFAPTNDAFAALPNGTLETLLLDENVEMLQDILQYHILSGNIPSTSVTSGTFETLLNEDSITIDVLNPGTEDPIITFNGGVGGVMDTDMIANNGIIHVIDTVLLPPASTKPNQAGTTSSPTSADTTSSPTPGATTIAPTPTSTELLLPNATLAPTSGWTIGPGTKATLSPTPAVTGASSTSEPGWWRPTASPTDPVEVEDLPKEAFDPLEPQPSSATMAMGSFSVVVFAAGLVLV